MLINVQQATPTFSGLTASQTITYGTATIDVAGTLSSPTASPVGQDVTITIDSVATTAIVGAGGSFTATIDTATVPASATPYVIAYDYAGDANFETASDSTTTVTVNKATPTFSGLTASQIIAYGTATIDVAGTLSSPTAIPVGQDVTVTINGAATTAEVGAGGSFTATIDTATLPASDTPYPIAYGYAGDTNFETASDSTTTLKVKQATPTVSVTDAGGTYNSDPFPATYASVTGVGTDGLIASFGYTTLSYSYYSGETPLNGAPTAAGAYTVVANYTSNNPNYTNAHSRAVGFTITPAALTISAVTDTKGYDGTTSSTQTPTYQVTGLAADTLYGTDTVTGLVQAFASKDVKGTGGSTLQVTAYTVNDGNSGNDYTVDSSGTALGTITPAALTISAVTDTKVYDSTTTDGAVPTVSGLKGSDTVTGLSESFVSKDVLGTGDSTLVVNSGYVANDGNSGNDYTVDSSGTALGTITPAALTISAVTDTKVYDSTTTDGAVPTVSGLKGSDTVTGLSESFVSKDVLGTGDSTLVVNSGYVVNDGNSGNDYTVDSSGTALGTITPAALTISAVTDTKVYDSTTTDGAVPTVSGLKGSDTVTGLSESFVSPNVKGLDGSTLAVSGYVVNDGNSGNNYAVTTGTVSGTITQDPIYGSFTAANKVYDSTTNATMVSTTVDGISASATQLGFSYNDGTNVATADLTVTNLGGGSYQATAGTLVVTGGSAAGTYTLLPGSGTSPSGQFTYDNILDTTAPVVDSQNGLVFVNSGTGNEINIWYNGNGGSASGAPGTYGFWAESGGNVTVKSGGAAQVNLNVADQLGLSGTPVFSSPNAGVETVTLTHPVLTGSNAGDYDLISVASTTANIAQAQLTITATSDTKVYDSTTTDGAVPTVSGLKGSDTVTGLSESFVSKDVLGTGDSTLVVNSGYVVNDGNSGNDYTVDSSGTALGTITPAALTISAVTDTKGYDGTTSSTQTPTYQVTGLAADTLYGTDTVTGLVQAFASKDVKGTGGSTLQVTAYTVNDGNGGADYTVTPETATGTIAPAALTISAVTDTKGYDGTTSSTQTPTYQVTGLAADTLYGTDTVTGLVQAFASKDVKGTGGSTLQVTAYTVNDGNSGNDYTVDSSGTALGTITPAALTISAVTDTKVYDSTTTDGAVPTVSGLKGSDTVTGLSESFVSKDVLGTGDSTLVVNSGYVVNDGNSGNDYTVDSSGTALGTITPAALTISAVTDTKVYDSTTTDGAVPTVSGLKGSDTVTGLSESFVSPNVKGLDGSTLAVSGYVVNDGNSGNNYAVTTGTVSGTITQDPIYGSFTAANKVYDSTTNATMVSTTVDGISASATQLGFSYNDGTNVATANLTVTNLGGGSYQATAGTLVVTGGSAAGTYTLLPGSGTSPSGQFTYDNILDTTAPVVDSQNGLVFVNSGTGNEINIWYNGNGGSAWGAPGTYGFWAESGGNVTVKSGGAAQVNLNVADQLGLSGTPVFSSPNAGVETVTLTHPVLTGSNAGDYDLISVASTTANIAQAQLTITATSDTKVYDSTTTDGAVPTVSGLKGSDTVTGLSESFVSKDVLGTGDSTLVVNSGYVVNDGNSGNDYTVDSSGTALGTITPAALTISAVTDTKGYDGTTSSTQTPTYQVTGLAADTLYGTDTVTGLVQAFASKDVKGTGGSTLQVTAYTVNDGNGGADYTVTPETATGTIAPAALTISAVTDTKGYDGTTSSTQTPTYQVTGLAADTLYGTDTVTGLVQAFASKDVKGTGGSTLAVSGYVVNDGNSGNNYAVTTGTVSGTITQDPIYGSFTAANKVYDSTTNATMVSTTVDGISASATQLGFSYNDGTNVATANLTVTNLGGGSYQATAGTLVVTGGSAAGTYTLLPGSGTSPSGQFTYDNILDTTAPVVDSQNGLVFVNSGTGNEINIWYNGNGGSAWAHRALMASGPRAAAMSP